MEILKLIGKKLRSIVSGKMEHYSNVFKQNLVATTRTVVLDYLFGEGDAMDAYQLVRFAEGEPWNVLYNGFLLGSLSKVDGIWISANGENLDGGRISAIGKFIDSQHFNLLPDKIKVHWEEQVKEVIMENDSSYMVVCRDGIEFDCFRLIFSSFVSELVEEEWPVVFSVYNAAFSDDFKVEVT
ncbi:MULTISPECIES: hypothetical protein [Pedobacter]|uniref:hypothetical protein n=1 Tax=Pedobacter TaxID=84567 RepID=UPI00292F5FFF|nr:MULTISPECIES: hypothetical protein [Pedobacter]